MEESILGRSQVEDNVVQASPRPTTWWTILTPIGLLALKQGDLQKLVVPRSLRQQIMRENHDVPSVGHVCMCSTLELVDRYFHWRGLRGDVL